MIKLADTLAPMADFPAVEAKDVAFNDNKSLQEKYDNGELGGGTGSGEENKIDSISVNGSPITPDTNKNVDITVPDAYDDTALVQRISDIESDYAKSSDIPSLSGYATETWVNEQGFLTQHQDLSNYVTKDEIPNLDGYAKTSEIPTKVSQLENDSNYLSSIPEEYVTDTELEAKGYLTEHQDISNLVEKEDGKGLSSNDYTTEEKNKLAGLENYNDTALSNRVKTVEDEVPNLATKTYVGEQIANAEHLKREIVTVLPSDEEASDNIIYMLKVESATGNDKYQEYMKIDGTVQMVGDTSVDLTDYAKSAEIPTTVAELTDSADYAKKTDIPTSLPADGGNADTVNNHTVKSDVPENAVFTDTIYDDTDIKAEIAKKADATSTPHIDETTKNWFIGDVDTGILAEGTNGTDGTTYTPSIGEVTTVDSTELASATVSIKEDTKEAVFNFAIPKGQNGEDGKDAEQRIYTTLAELGLTAPVTVGDIFNAMKDKTIVMIGCEDITDNITDVPMSYGVLTIKKGGIGRFSIEYQNSSYNTSSNVKKWIGTLKGADGTGLKWTELATMDKVNASLGELCNKKIYCGEVTGTIVNGRISTSNPIGKAGNVIVTMKYQSNLTPYGYCVTTQTTLSELNFYFRWHRESDGAEAYPPNGTEITISYMIFY